jgi:hypothetical protein
MRREPLASEKRGGKNYATYLMAGELLTEKEVF